MIRKATQADMPRLMELAKRMHEESPRYCQVEFDAFLCAHVISDAIGTFLAPNPNRCVLLSEVDGVIVGGIVGLAIRHFFSREAYATDIALFIEPEHRGGVQFARLIAAFEKWAMELEVSEVVLGVSTGVKTEETESAFKRLKYVQFGHLFVKRLQHGIH